MAQHTRTDTTPRATFVYPDSSPAELAPLPPAQAIQILPPALAIQIEDVLEGRILAIERTSPLPSAEAFLLKYAGTTFILAIPVRWPRLVCCAPLRQSSYFCLVACRSLATLRSGG